MEQEKRVERLPSKFDVFCDGDWGIPPGNVKIPGSLFVNGDIYCGDINVAGDVTIDGEVNCEDVHVNGDFTVNGDAECCDISVAGDVTVNANLKCNDLDVAGNVASGGNIKCCDDAYVIGELECKRDFTCYKKIRAKKGLLVLGNVNINRELNSKERLE